MQRTNQSSKPSGSAAPPETPSTDSTAPRIFERTEAYSAVSGASMYAAPFGGLIQYITSPRPITVEVGRRHYKILSVEAPDFDPGHAISAISLQCGYDLIHSTQNLRQSLLDISSAPFAHVQAAKITMPSGADFTVEQFINMSDDPPLGATLAIRNLITGVCLYPLLHAALPDLPKRVMEAKSPIPIDIEQLYLTMFLSDRHGAGHERRLVDAMNAVSTRLILDKPYGQHIKPLTRTVEHLCKLHGNKTRSSGQ